jgi:tryptophan synthase alpha chain
MNRIEARFDQRGSAGQAAFVPFLTAGDPTPEATLALMQGAESAGADVIELGFPFSDPIADGPTIQDSYHRVLSRGQTAEDVFAMVEEARRSCELPIVAMVTYSIVFRMGFERFLERCLEAGIDGATIPDLPIEEALPLFGQAAERDFRLVCFVAPSTTPERRRLVVEQAHGFIYYMAVRGITGERAELPRDLFENLQQLKSLTPVPVAVGFGISRPDQARAVAEAADGVIVGSAIVRRMAKAEQEDADPAEAALQFIEDMAAATHEA